MARKPRVHYPGAFYHVILRGNGGQSIFFDDKDRTHFYFLAQEGIERFGHRWPTDERNGRAAGEHLGQAALQMRTGGETPTILLFSKH